MRRGEWPRPGRVRHGRCGGCGDLLHVHVFEDVELSFEDRESFTNHDVLPAGPCMGLANIPDWLPKCKPVVRVGPSRRRRWQPLPGHYR